jgi:CO/xanthine dehydrogenase FAD-binding subunit
VAALLALGATVTAEGDDGPAEITLEAMLQDGGGNLSAVHVPPVGTDVRVGEATVARTPAEAPIVAAFAALEFADGVVRQVRVALSGVWPEPARLAASSALLPGGPLDLARIEAVAAAVAEEVAPKGDFLGSEEYRRAMAGVLTRRALASCLPGGREGDD